MLEANFWKRVGSPLRISPSGMARNGQRLVRGYRGNTNPISHLTVVGNKLYARADAEERNGKWSLWDGQRWMPLGSQSNWASRLWSIGDDLYATGGLGNRKVAKWVDEEWLFLGSGTKGSVRAMAVMGGDLYVGGQFTAAGGKIANNVAKWDGRKWSPIGSGVTDPLTSKLPFTRGVMALAASSRHLYVGGNFQVAGVMESRFLARVAIKSPAPVGIAVVDANVRIEFLPPSQRLDPPF